MPEAGAAAVQTERLCAHCSKPLFGPLSSGEDIAMKGPHGLDYHDYCVAAAQHVANLAVKAARKAKDEPLLQELLKKFPEVGRETLAKVIDCDRHGLDFEGPWVVFYEYPEDRHFGVTSFDEEQNLISGLEELLFETKSEILHIYRSGKPQKFERIVKWTFEE